MNRRLASVLFFALLVASTASFLVYRLILVRVQSQSQGQTVSTRKLLVAKHDLQVGTLIRDFDVDEVPWGAPIPDDAVKSRPEVLQRGVVATVFQGEPILERRLASRGAGAGLAATIPMGMRAVALRVNEVVGLAGFVLPGMRVDVLVAGSAPGSPNTVCRTVLQNIEVLSAGQKLEKNNEAKPESAQVVNLLVTPAQAETLNLASESRVQLVLRNPLDTKSAETAGTTLAKLYGVPEIPAARFNSPSDSSILTPIARPHPKTDIIRPALPAMTVIEVFNGAKRSQESFELSGGSK